MSPPAPDPPAVEFAGVNAWFGATHVLRDIDLAVAQAETVVICGPSGSGKSTLIRAINGLVDHQSGTIRVAADAQDFAAQVLALLDAPADAAELGRAARAQVLRRYGWDARLAPLDALFGVDGSRSPS